MIKKLSFSNHIESLILNSNLKLLALRRIRKFLTTEKAKVLCNAFINSQFNYVPIIWMFCGKQHYEKIKKIHYKSLKVVFQTDGTYEELLDLSNESSIHQRHLRFLVTEIFKTLNNLNPSFMKKYFCIKETGYNLRKGQILRLPPTNTSSYGINSIQFRGNMVWNNLPSEIKNCESVLELKRKLKLYRSIDCSCLICR